jgi:hypothetical protein
VSDLFNGRWDDAVQVGVPHLLVVETTEADTQPIDRDLHDWAASNGLPPDNAFHRGESRSPCLPLFNRTIRARQWCPWCPAAEQCDRDVSVKPGVAIQGPAVVIGFLPVGNAGQPTRDCLARAQDAGLPVRVFEAGERR